MNRVSKELPLMLFEHDHTLSRCETPYRLCRIKLRLLHNLVFWKNLLNNYIRFFMRTTKTFTGKKQRRVWRFDKDKYCERNKIIYAFCASFIFDSPSASLAAVCFVLIFAWNGLLTCVKCHAYNHIKINISMFSLHLFFSKQRDRPEFENEWNSHIDTWTNIWCYYWCFLSICRHWIGLFTFITVLESFKLIPHFTFLL